MSEIKQVVLVGHCGFDAGSIQRAVARADPEVKIADVSRAEAVDEAGPDTLLLINRQIGGMFSSSSGVDLIQRLAEKDDPPKMMLVSNFADAQEQAVAAGALPGFGKSELGADETLAKLRSAIRG
jgi:hypothetical protein